MGVAAPGDAIEHYWDTERDADGDERQVERERAVATQSPRRRSSYATGEIVVEVAGADVDNAPVRSSRRGFVNVARILAIAFAAVGVVLIVLGLIL